MPCRDGALLELRVQEKLKAYEFVKDQYDDLLLRENPAPSLSAEKKCKVNEAKSELDEANRELKAHVGTCKPCTEELTY